MDLLVDFHPVQKNSTFRGSSKFGTVAPFKVLETSVGLIHMIYSFRVQFFLAIWLTKMIPRIKHLRKSMNFDKS